jgi:hypothetical protein
MQSLQNAESYVHINSQSNCITFDFMLLILRLGETLQFIHNPCALALIKKEGMGILGSGLNHLESFQTLYRYEGCWDQELVPEIFASTHFGTDDG